MNNNSKTAEPQEKKKGFFAKIIEKLDKKLEEKSKNAGCCSNNKGKSCC